MSDLSRDPQADVPGAPGTPEGEAGPSESNPIAPSVEGRDVPESGTESRVEP